MHTSADLLFACLPKSQLCKTNNSILWLLFVECWGKKYTLRRRRRRIYQLTPDVSDGWTTDDLKYQWKKDDPVQITHDLHLPRFSLEKYVSDYCNIKTNTGGDEERKKCSSCICITLGIFGHWQSCFCFAQEEDFLEATILFIEIIGWQILSTVHSCYFGG